MTVNTAGGVVLSIGPAVVQSALPGMTLATLQGYSYTEVAEVEDAGQVGDESALVTFTALADGRVRKFKGARDAGTMTVVCGADMTDAGQVALELAETTIFDYAIEVVLNDATSLSGTGTTLYFCAKVSGLRINIGNVANVVKRTFQLAVDTPLFIAAPT